MSTACRYCWVVSRNACSEYSGQALVEELASCGNLSRESQLRHASSAEGYSGPYTAQLRAYEAAEEDDDIMERMYNMLNDVFCESPVDRSKMEDLLKEYEQLKERRIYR